MARRGKHAPEVRERAIGLVRETLPSHSSEWAAITSVAQKIGCTPETLRKWIRRSQRDGGTRPGPTTEDKTRIKELEHEVHELRRANEILCKASAFSHRRSSTAGRSDGGFHRPAQGRVRVESMCSVLPIAPSTYYEHARRRKHPELRPARQKRDEQLETEIRRVYEDNQLKAELIYRRGPWKSREAVELATLTWVDWFNNRRLLEPLGYAPPAEFESAYFEKKQDPAMVVGFN